MHASRSAAVLCAALSTLALVQSAGAIPQVPIQPVATDRASFMQAVADAGLTLEQTDFSALDEGEFDMVEGGSDQDLFFQPLHFVQTWGINPWQTWTTGPTGGSRVFIDNLVTPNAYAQGVAFDAEPGQPDRNMLRLTVVDDQGNPMTPGGRRKSGMLYFGPTRAVQAFAFGLRGSTDIDGSRIWFRFEKDGSWWDEVYVVPPAAPDAERFFGFIIDRPARQVFLKIDYWGSGNEALITDMMTGIRWPDACSSDVNADGTVTTADLTQIITELGQTASFADVDSSGSVDTGDLLTALTFVGQPCGEFLPGPGAGDPRPDPQPDDDPLPDPDPQPDPEPQPDPQPGPTPRPGCDSTTLPPLPKAERICPGHKDNTFTHGNHFGTGNN